MRKHKEQQRGTAVGGRNLCAERNASWKKKSGTESLRVSMVGRAVEGAGRNGSPGWSGGRSRRWGPSHHHHHHRSDRCVTRGVGADRRHGTVCEPTRPPVQYTPLVCVGRGALERLIATRVLRSEEGILMLAAKKRRGKENVTDRNHEQHPSSSDLGGDTA